MRLRKRGFYPKQRIDELAEERARMLGEVAQAPERFVFVLPQRDDLEQLVDIERMFFHESILVPPEEQQKQLTYNPEAIHVLKDSKTNTVVGGVSISPIKPEVLEKLISLEIDEAQIKPEDYLPYTTDPPLDCYIIDFVVRPGLMATYYGSKLMQATLDYFIELLNRGVVIRRIYAAAVTKFGERLTKGLHFKPLQRDWTREHQPDLIIFDTMLKDMDALAMCREMRSKHDALVIVVTSGKNVQDEVRCLESVADDYLRKPFFPAQLLARIRAVSRRGRSTLTLRPSSLITIGPITVDSLHNKVTVYGKTARLTPTESKMLHLLAVNANAVCTLEQIIAHAWSFGDDADRSLIKAHIRHLRQKVELDPGNPRFLLTVPGVGYTLEYRHADKRASQEKVPTGND